MKGELHDANPIPSYADEVVYEGKHDPMEEVCVIRWLVADVLDMMAYLEIELTDENLERVLGNRFEHTLQDRSTEEGWEIIQYLEEDAF